MRKKFCEFWPCVLPMKRKKLLDFKYSQVFAKDHPYRTTTCLKRPPLWVLFSAFNTQDYLWIVTTWQQRPLFFGPKEGRCTGGPRYSRTFYLRIRLFTLTKLVKNDNFLVKNGFSFANSGFTVQNDGTYLPWITRETDLIVKA